MNHSVSDCVICEQWYVYDGVRTYTFRKDNEGRATQACTTVLGGSSSEWNRTWASGKLMIAGIIQDYTSFELCPHGRGSCNYHSHVDVAYCHIFLPFCRWAWVWSFYWWLWIIYSIFTCLPPEVPGTLAGIDMLHPARKRYVWNIVRPQAMGGLSKSRPKSWSLLRISAGSRAACNPFSRYTQNGDFDTLSSMDDG